MIVLRYLLLLILLGIVPLTHSACNGMLPKVLYGPYFSLSFIQEFFKEVHKHFEVATGCQPRIIVSRSFEEFFTDLGKQDGDLVVVAPPYIEQLEKVGYRQVVSGLAVTFQLVVHKDSGIRTLSDLKNKSVALHSELSMAAALWRHWMRNEIQNSSIKVIYGGTGDSAFMRLLKNEADVAIIVNWLFDRLHPSLKQNLLVIEDYHFDRVATVMSSSKVSAEIRTKLIKGLIDSSSSQWHPKGEKFKADAILEKALQRHIPLNKTP